MRPIAAMIARIRRHTPRLHKVTMGGVIALAIAILLPGKSAHAMPPPPAHLRVCFQLASTLVNIPEPILWAIAWQESRYRHDAFNRNRNGSYDVGIMQINSSWKPHLEERGISWEYVKQYTCINILIGAYILLYEKQRSRRDMITAIARYHSPHRHRGQRYAEQIVKHIKRLAEQNTIQNGFKSASIR